MEKNLQTVDAVQTAPDQTTPVELTTEQLTQVGGGVAAPNSTW
jgi:hypothetical protein